LTPFLWPALAAATASEMFLALTKELAHLPAGHPSNSTFREPRWTTPNQIALELPSMRLRKFLGGDDIATLICAPLALHDATLTDFAPDHSFAAVWRAIEILGPRVGLEVTSIAFRNPADDIESAIGTFAKSMEGGLIVLPTAVNNLDRERIISLAATHRLPAVYPFPPYTSSGGLVSYGINTVDVFRRSASYVDRILRGEKPADLPVQAPTKYELVINLKTARALGLEVPPTLIARADEVIE
jgi:ABC transporter substrate binding protein